MPGIFPTDFTSFGYRFLQKTSTGVWHPGVDIGKPGWSDYGQPVRAFLDGTVRFISQNKYNSGWGLHLWIEHTNNLWSHYAHLQYIEYVIAHDGEHDVIEGQEIGKLGNSGASTGPHVHFEIMKHRPDYWTFYPNRKSRQWVQDHYHNPLTYIPSPMSDAEKLDRLKELSDEIHDVRVAQKDLELKEDGLRSQQIEILES